MVGKGNGVSVAVSASCVFSTGCAGSRVEDVAVAGGRGGGAAAARGRWDEEARTKNEDKEERWEEE